LEDCAVPWTEEQRKLFNAAAGNKEIARQHGLAPGEARTLADEANKLKGENKEKKASDIEVPMGVIDLRPVWGSKTLP
jgi:hypothetical protein